MSSRLALALVIAASLILSGVALYWRGRLEADRLDRSKVAAAESSAKAAGLETKGARLSAAQVAASTRTRESAAETVSQLSPDIHRLENADAPLDTRRAERLRTHDHQLCDLAPELTGCATGSDAP